MDHKAAWRERTRSWAVALLGGCCARCGKVNDLDFDHIDAASKTFEISIGIRNGYGRARIEAELAKCQLLCHTCHVEKSLECGDVRVVEHGGGKTGKRNCYCPPCRAKKNEYMREFKKAKRAAVAQMEAA